MSRALQLDQDDIDLLTDSYSPPPPPKKKRGRPRKDDFWHPDLNERQKESFDSHARYVLAHGEKGSGKTIGLLHKVVRHCYENRNALGLILVKVKSMATKGGAWDKLTAHILPRWKEGLGIEYSDVKHDAQHNEYLWVENLWGEWSMIVLISAPHADQLRQRIRGYEPSIVFVDELTSCDSIVYFNAVSAQIGRREGIDGLQQYLAACNPEGPSHWVYKVWWEDCFDLETGEWDDDFHKIHIPIQENVHNLPDGYLENLSKVFRSDPIEKARMMHGEWIERPSGTSLFVDIWNEQIHVYPPPGAPEVGSEKKPPSKARIQPKPAHAFYVGMDPGATHNAFVFAQYLPTSTGMKWVPFDEVSVIKKRITYGILIPIVLRRAAFWMRSMTAKGSTKGPYSFPGIVWVSDSSAFNQFRPGSKVGTGFDVLEIQKIAAVYAPKLGLPPVIVVQAPKFDGSVISRTRICQDLLAQELIVVSSACRVLRTMFSKLEQKPQAPGIPFNPDNTLTPKRGPYIHIWDAFSYLLIMMVLHPQLMLPRKKSTQSFS